MVDGALHVQGGTAWITVDHEPRPSTHSDTAFGRMYFEKVTAGRIRAPGLTVFDGGGMNELAAEENARLVRTNLTGKKRTPILADFTLLGDGGGVALCPEGHAPTRNTRRGECRPKIGKRVAGKVLRPSSVRCAQETRFRSTGEFSGLSAPRNGVESINGQPSAWG